MHTNAPTYSTTSEDLEGSHDEFRSLMNSKIHYIKCTTLTFTFSLFLCTIVTRDMIGKKENHRLDSKLGNGEIHLLVPVLP